jgi:hypothetical protein
MILLIAYATAEVRITSGRKGASGAEQSINGEVAQDP